VVRLQMALEETCARAADLSATVVCHRGTLDLLAYWLRKAWDEGKFSIEISRGEHHRHYLGVIRLQTVAIGAELHDQAQ
jgi:hypothetical protein